MSPRPSPSRHLLDRLILMRESNLEKKMENLIQVIKHLHDQVEFLQGMISGDHIAFKTGAASLSEAAAARFGIPRSNRRISSVASS
jgi:hypothetical protein